MNKNLGIVPIIFFCFVFIPGLSFAGKFSVSPLRIDLDSNSKSGSLNVANEGSEEITIQIRGVAWTQDETGKDQYGGTKDVIFYPKMITLRGGEERVVRAGIKFPSAGTEKTYRLFVEEIPKPKAVTEKASISFLYRFGIPVFVKPIKEIAKGSVENISISQNAATALLRNAGNLHLLISSVNFKCLDSQGLEIFSKDLPGWYILAGSSRAFMTEIPKEICPRVRKLSVEVRSDRLNFNGELNVQAGMCAP